GDRKQAEDPDQALAVERRGRQLEDEARKQDREREDAEGWPEAAAAAAAAVDAPDQVRLGGRAVIPNRLQEPLGLGHGGFAHATKRRSWRAAFHRPPGRSPQLGLNPGVEPRFRRWRR